MFTWEWIKYGFGPNYSNEYVPFYSKHHTNTEKFLHIDLTYENELDIKDPIQAGVDAIDKITKHYPPPYVLMMSGGVDSQCMLHIWLKSGKKFQTKSFIYNHIYNYHDLSNLLTISNNLKFKFDFENIDAFDFFANELKDYGIGYNCTSPQICLYIKMAEQIKEGTAIFAGNFINSNGVTINYPIFGLHRYQIIKNANIVPFFLTYTPELAYSLQEKYIENYKQLSDDKISDISYNLKVKTLLDYNFPIISQSTKLSGFELIKNYYDTYYPLNGLTKSKYYNYANNRSRRSFDIHLRYSLEEMMPYSSETICKIGKSKPKNL